MYSKQNSNISDDKKTQLSEPTNKNVCNNHTKSNSQAESNFKFNWCSITYYEHERKVGFYEAFYQLIQIDGYCNPNVNSNRFSLGLLSNIHRTQASVCIRNIIGSGILLKRDSNLIRIKCGPDFPIYVQSNIGNSRLKFDKYSNCRRI